TIGDGAQRNAVDVETESSAHNGFAISGGIRDADARTKIQPARFHRIDDPLHVVAQPCVDRQIASDLPFVLDEPSQIWIGLEPVTFSKGLPKGLVASSQKGGHILKGVTAVIGARENDVQPVIEDVRAELEDVRSPFEGEVIRELDQVDI